MDVERLTYERGEHWYSGGFETRDGEWITHHGDYGIVVCPLSAFVKLAGDELRAALREAEKTGTIT